MRNPRIIIAVFFATLLCVALVPVSASAWFISADNLGGAAPLVSTASVMESTKLKTGETTIECTGISLNGAEIVAPSKGAATSIVFKGCTASGGGCSISKTEIGTLPITAELTQQGVLEAKGAFLPATGKTFATIKYEGSECALSGVQPVTGKATLSMPTGQMEKTSQEVKLSTTTEGELKIGSGSATLKGAYLLQLATGQPWSFGGSALYTASPKSGNFGEDELEHVADFTITITPSINLEFGTAIMSYISGPTMTAFSVPSRTCTGAVNAGTPCTVVVAFNPTMMGVYRSNLLLQVRPAGAPTYRTDVYPFQGIGT
jgi:hypothetical protein